MPHYSSASLAGLTATQLTLWVVKNRMVSKRSHGIGSVSDHVQRILIRIDTDGGPSGYGEADPWAVFSGTVESAVSTLQTYLWPQLQHQPIADIPKVMARLDRTVVGQSEAKVAIETALYDIVGKTSGLPIYQLLGGKYRDHIPFSFSLANPDLDADLEMAQQMVVEDGHHIFKIKTGFTAHREDVQRVGKIRDTLPDHIDLRIDYNQGLEPFGAVSKLREMEQFKLTFIEQPVKAHQLEAMAELTRRLDTPILADESVFDPQAALRGIQAKIADAFSIKIMKTGILQEAQKMAAVAEMAGLPCYGGTLFEGAIALNAAAHLIAATPNISLGCEFYMPKYMFAPDELEGSVDIRDGLVYPPNGPGLGIEIDEDVIEKLVVTTITL